MGLVQTKTEASVETSPQLIESLHMAREVALKSDVAEVLPAHLVLAMLEDDESSFLLDAYGVDFNKVRTQLGKIVQTKVKPKSHDRHAIFSAGIETIMQHAREQAQKNALAEVDSNLILAVILSEKNGFLGGMLAPYDLDTSGVLQYLELREGKTVNIDPLPSLQNKAAPAEKNAPSPARAPAPPATHTATQTAPQQVPPEPRSVTGPTVAKNQTADTPVENHQSDVQVSPSQPSVPRPNAPAPQQSVSKMPPPPKPAPAPVRENQTPASPQPSPQQGLAELSNKLQSPVSKNEVPPSSASMPIASSPSNEAPSRLRSMIGKIGFDKIGEKFKGNANAPEAAASPQNSTAQPPTRLAPTPANNNQSPSGAKSNLIPPSEPANATGPMPSPQPTSPAPAPALAAVDQLVAPDHSAHNDARNTPVSPIPMSQQNRPAKRRRAVPASLGSNESLSATGSVLEKGRLVEAVPRKMKMNKPSRAEVRITREQLDEINSEFEVLSANHIHDLAVTEAMTVQLRAPGSGFHIENLSPQTQWIDRNQRHINDADFGVWRWNVTPIKSGKSRLQLVISARTVDDDGNIHIADIPDKVIELSIAKDFGKGLQKMAFLAFLIIASLALGRYGEAAWQWGATFVSKLGM